MKEELLTRMIMLYGFEHEAVIAFAGLLESDTFTEEMLEAIVVAHEEHPIVEEEEEEEEEEE